MKYTVQNMVRTIASLSRDRRYNYVNPKTGVTIEILNVKIPFGPVTIKRSCDGKSKEATISTPMMERVAAAISEGMPINLDRVLGASYNTRSALEALLAHTSEFYFCYPGRISPSESSVKVLKGHKHIVWKPSAPHRSGEMEEIKTQMVISESAACEIVYDEVGALHVEESSVNEYSHARRHAQIQYLLAQVGYQFGYKIWIAQNDRGVKIGEKSFAEMPGVLPTLKEGTVIANFSEAAHAARLIDCIWFKNGRLMPAVFEVEHSTGVTSGLTRMKAFRDILPPFPSRYVIAAPDEDRAKVFAEFDKAQFRDLKPEYLSYSAIEELAGLCRKRKIMGVTDEFIDSFCESAN
jgi:type II restriction enzyme